MTGKLIEVAYVVDDMDEAIEHWTRDLGVGPFFTGIFEVPEQNYGGTVSTGRTNVAFGFSNGVLIELIKPVGDSPCIFSEAGPGFHHLMFQITDHDAEVARYAALGCHVVQSGTFAGSPFSIIDTRETNGGYTEVMAFGEGLQNLYSRLKAASESWDGTAPRRYLFENA